MSVLIKGMQMPDRCIDCPFMISRDNDDCILQSDAANELFMNWDDMKLNCPLVELPEHHGRLFDQDDVKAVLYDVPDAKNKWDAIALLEWAIDKRWCIEAEGENE